MAALKVMIVDDSPFSRTILARIVEEIGYEVVGEADGFETLLATYDRCQPDIVTIDIAMPGADGFECSKALLAHAPQAKIVLASSMKDEETEADAKRIGVVGYIQKPVEPELMKRVFTNVLAPDALFQSLNETGLDVFKEALAQNITRMTKSIVTFKNEIVNEIQFTSQGITVVIGIIGRYSGSVIIDISENTAEQITKAILRREANSQDEVLAMAAEFANIVAGVACSILNKKNKALGLRVAPPNVFYGAPTEVVSPNITSQGIFANTDYGDVFLYFGFKGETVLWM